MSPTYALALYALSRTGVVIRAGFTPDKIGCDNGSSPQITYLTTDPRTTGEMHAMFVAP